MIYLCEQLFLHDKVLSFQYKLGNLSRNEGFAVVSFTSVHHRCYSKIFSYSNDYLLIGSFIFVPELYEQQADRVHYHNITFIPCVLDYEAGLSCCKIFK